MPFNNAAVWSVSCPLQDASEPVEVEVYRIVKNDPPIEDDFKTYFELGKPVSGGVRSQCKAKAVSVFTDLEAAKKMARLKPTEFGTLIAKGLLVYNMGKILTSDSSHVNWWVCDTHANMRSDDFIVVDRI